MWSSFDLDIRYEWNSTNPYEEMSVAGIDTWSLWMVSDDFNLKESIPFTFAHTSPSTKENKRKQNTCLQHESNALDRTKTLWFRVLLRINMTWHAPLFSPKGLTRAVTTSIFSKCLPAEVIDIRKYAFLRDNTLHCISLSFQIFYFFLWSWDFLDRSIRLFVKSCTWISSTFSTAGNWRIGQ